MIVLEKIVGVFFFWGVFPWAFLRYGVMRGATGLFVFQFVLSVVFIIAYDAIGRDLFGIEAVKQRLLTKAKNWLKFVLQIVSYVVFVVAYEVARKYPGIVEQKWSHLFAKAKSWSGWKCGVLWLRKFGWILELFFFSWQFFAPVALLCLRKVDSKPRYWRDIGILFASSLFATVFWTSLHRGVISVVWNWLKKMI